MGNDEITRLSRREHALYGELAALYRGMLEALTDERAPVDLSRLAADGARADAAVGALAVLEATLAPVRRAGDAVAEVVALWQASATVAADAAVMNRELVVAARVRQTRIASRSAALRNGRRVLTGYRPSGANVTAIDRRA